MVVHVAEPHGAPRLRVPVDRRLRALDGLQPHGVAVGAPDHVEVHVELGRDGLGDLDAHGLHRVLLGGAGQHPQRARVQVGHRDAHLALLQQLVVRKVLITRRMADAFVETLADETRRAALRTIAASLKSDAVPVQVFHQQQERRDFPSSDNDDCQA